MVKAAVDAAAMKTADQGAVAAKTIMGSVGFGSGSSPRPGYGIQESGCTGRLHSSFHAVPLCLETPVCKATV
jgi:hypothetical protein